MLSRNLHGVILTVNFGVAQNEVVCLHSSEKIGVVAYTLFGEGQF